MVQNEFSLLLEALDGLSNPNLTYSANSSPPRKDFAPQSSQSGYNFPYQRNTPPVFAPTPPTPEAPINLPAPMQLISQDFAQAAFYIIEALRKMENVIDNYPGLDNESLNKLKQYAEEGQKVVFSLSELDFKINKDLNLSSEQPSINPLQEKPAPV